jgi:flagellar FliJ protein
MFRFNLEKVLQVRKRLVDDEARKLQSIEAAAHALEHENAAMAAQCSDAGRRVQAGGFDLRRHQLLAGYVAGRQRLMQANEARIATIRTEADRQREILLQVQRDKAVLENLRDRQREAWAEEERRREQKLMDEVASRRSVLST